MSNDIKRIGVFSSGGDAPGMNAAIRAVVRTASYHDLHIYGIFNGYEGMIAGNIKRLDKSDVANIIHRGGTILKTSRSEEFRTAEGRKKAYESLAAENINGCIAIGGNGTFTGASIFSNEYNIPIVGVPGTIDNDIYGTDYTIGFDTAINTAVEAIDKIRDTADSHSRLFFIEVMGRHSGDIALNTGIGSGAGTIFIPEREIQIKELVDKLNKSFNRKKLFSLVVVAEGNVNGDAMQIAEKVKAIQPDLDSRVTIIGHLQRGGSPTAADRVLASRLGYSAVNALLDGKSKVAVGVINSKIAYTSFDDAIKKAKSIDGDLLAMAEILAL